MIDLQVQQQFGRIGLKITPFQYDLTIRPADLEIQQRPAEFTLEQPAASLEIDYTPARESLGYCGIAAQQQVFNQDAKATSDAGISLRVFEGDQFRNLSRKVSVAKIISQALEPRTKDLQLVSIQPIRITVTSNFIVWKANVGGVSTNSVLGSVHGEFQNGSVHSFMEQNPYIGFHAVGSIIDSHK